jgi:hypothetical protein
VATMNNRSTSARTKKTSSPVFGIARVHAARSIINI